MECDVPQLDDVKQLDGVSQYDDGDKQVGQRGDV